MENDILTGIGQRMAEIRRMNHITQEKLADLLDVSPKHISHCENETSYLSLKNLIKFCNLFHCSLDYLVLGKYNDAILSQLPNEILTILQIGSAIDIDRLNRFLQIYIELQSSSNSEIETASQS